MSWDSGLDITVSLSIAVGVITGDPCLGAAPGIGLQSAVGAAVLVIAAEAGVHQAQGVNLHIRKLHLQDELRIAAGIIIILFSLQMLGLFNFQILNQ